jgi:hypothetical protein
MKVADISELTKEDLLGKLGLMTVPALSKRLLGWTGMFGAGLLAGAGVMLLFAPKAGHETRQHLGRRLRNLRDDAEEFVGSAASRVAENCK